MDDGLGKGFRARPAIGDLIANLQTDMQSVRVGPHNLPMTISDGPPTCYICCPSAAYLDYAADELRHFAHLPWLKATLSGLIQAARPLMRVTGLDVQVQPNNHLFSTNLLPELESHDIRVATEHLTKRWPKHAIVWRSLTDGPQFRRFLQAGYVSLPMRQVYLFDARVEPPKVRRDEKNDRRLMAQSVYCYVGPDAIHDPDFERMIALYNQLYREKYSVLNPQYTPLFLRRAHADGSLAIHGFRNEDGVLDAFVAFYRCGDTVTAPLIGYDTSLSRELGLYRLIMALCLEKARAGKWLYHMSAGAAAFKTTRGGVAAIEYMVIYNRHLPWYKRAATALAGVILRCVALPLVQRFER